MIESSATSSSQEINRSELVSSASSTDVKALEEQIENLKAVVENLKDDIEKKEVNIAKLAREKEKISMDLIKQKRSNTSILKQLEDERKFYFQEKELYCQEMNELKGLKRSLSRSSIAINEKTTKDLKNELENVKKNLKQTLEANYNLSIKFLRIKNTKAFLKNEMLKMKIEHERIFNDLQNKIEMMHSEIEDIVTHKSHLYVSPSNRKYVQLVRQNNSLVHENLCLQKEIEQLNSQFEKIKLKYTKSETNNRLKYVHSLKSELHAHCKHSKKEKKKVRITTEDKAIMVDEKPEKLPKSNLKTTKCQPEIIKIFERSESGDTPVIKIVNEEESRRHHHKKHKKSCRKHVVKADNEETKAVMGKEVNDAGTSPKPRLVKLASIAEIDETEKLNT